MCVCVVVLYNLNMVNGMLSVFSFFMQLMVFVEFKVMKTYFVQATAYTVLFSVSSELLQGQGPHSS